MKLPIRLFLLGLCAGSLLCVQATRADDSSTTTTPPPAKTHNNTPRLPPGFDQLDLTDSQKADILKIIKDTQDEEKQKIDEVLTDDQKAKLEQLKPTLHHGPGGNNGAPTPPPAN